MVCRSGMPECVHVEAGIKGSFTLDVILCGAGSLATMRTGVRTAICLGMLLCAATLITAQPGNRGGPGGNNGGNNGGSNNGGNNGGQQRKQPMLVFYKACRASRCLCCTCIQAWHCCPISCPSYEYVEVDSGHHLLSLL